MNITPDTILLVSDNKCYFTMSFKTDQTIEYMTACMLQFLSPDDIIFLIKSCFKFNKNGYLLAVSAASASAAMIGELPLTL